MNPAKLTPALSRHLGASGDSDLVDVVVELQQSAVPAGEAGSGRDRIASYKEAFSRQAEPIEDAIAQAGGEVLGRAWINRTLRVKVPSRFLDSLSESESVAALDLPKPIAAESD